MRRRLVLILVAVVASGLAVGAYAAGVRVSRVSNVDVYVTAVNFGQTDIGYASSRNGPALGTYDLRGLVEWADGPTGPWRPVGANIEGGRPRCIPEGSYGAKVRLYLVRAPYGFGRRDVDRVVRLRCL
jgi:hypothetical protein